FLFVLCRPLRRGAAFFPYTTLFRSWTCTSAGWSTPCCTCCTHGSGTRCCSTAGTSPARSRSTACSTRATSRPSPTPTPAGCTSRPGCRRRGRRHLHVSGRARHPGVREDGQVAEERRRTRRHVRAVRRGHPARVRDVDGPAGPLAPVGDPGRGRLAALPAAAV